MATLEEAAIRNIQACILMPEETSTPQLLATYDTIDAEGNTVRRQQSPDWFPGTPPENQAAIMALIASFITRAKTESDIPTE